MGESSHSAGTQVKPEADEPVAWVSRLPAWAWALGGLLLGLLATATLVSLEHHDLSRQASARHALIARRTVGQIEREIDAAGLELRAVQSAYLVSADIDQPRFATIVANLQAQRMAPSLVAVAYAPRSTDAAGRPRYAYTRAAPWPANRVLVGLDIVSQPENLAALERARDLGGPVLSAAFRLRQSAGDPRDTDGVVVRLRVYRPGPLPATPA